DIKNATEHRLGVPLPKGKVRVYKADASGSQQFVGEDWIDHTPKDERVKIKMGEAFDLVGERTQKAFRKIGLNLYEDAWAISPCNGGRARLATTPTHRARGSGAVPARVVAAAAWSRGRVTDVALSAEQPMTRPAGETVAPVSLPSATPAADTGRRRRAPHQELAVRAGVALLMLGFNQILTVAPAVKGFIRVAAVLGLLVNVPYYLAARSNWRRRLQAWVRMIMDVGFITAGLYAAGGLAASAYLAVYAIVPVYTGIVFSSVACVVVTVVATLAFLAMAGAQTLGLLQFMSAPRADMWEMAIFNLLVLNIVRVLAAMLADAYRRSRHHLAAAYGELERAHEQSLRMHAQIQ